jgi:hypothetical protein
MKPAREAVTEQERIGGAVLAGGHSSTAGAHHVAERHRNLERNGMELI